MSQLNPTSGERRVGWDFIPTGNDVADGIKTQCAGLIDLISNYEEYDVTVAHEAQLLIEQGCKKAVELMGHLKNPERGSIAYQDFYKRKIETNENTNSDTDNQPVE